LMNYIIVSARGDINPELVNALPGLRGKTHELRQWSVRTGLVYNPIARLIGNQRSIFQESGEKREIATSPDSPEPDWKWGRRETESAVRDERDPWPRCFTLGSSGDEWLGQRV
jgi:hypothetical protein